MKSKTDQNDGSLIKVFILSMPMAIIIIIILVVRLLLFGYYRRCRNSSHWHITGMCWIGWLVGERGREKRKRRLAASAVFRVEGWCLKNVQWRRKRILFSTWLNKKRKDLWFFSSSFRCCFFLNSIHCHCHKSIDRSSSSYGVCCLVW